MPRTVGSFLSAGGTRSTSGGSFFESALYDPDFGCPRPPSTIVNTPSAVKVIVMPPAGTGRSIPPVTAFSPTHSPTMVDSFFGASLGPGAATNRATPVNIDAYMNHSG